MPLLMRSSSRDLTLTGDTGRNISLREGVVVVFPYVQKVWSRSKSESESRPVMTNGMGFKLFHQRQPSRTIPKYSFPQSLTYRSRGAKANSAK